MVRRTPFYAFLTKISSEGKSCPLGSTMVAGKCTPTPVSSSESKTISLTKNPIRLGSSIQSTEVTIGTRVPEKIKTPVVAVKPKTELAVPGVSSEATPMKSQIAAIREKLVIGATGSSASSTTSAGKAITTPTISLARPAERSTPNTASGGASEALPHEVGARPSRSEPITFKKKLEWIGPGEPDTYEDYLKSEKYNTANPNKLIPVTEEKPITLGGGISVTAENQPVLYSGTRRIRSVPIKM